jgi:hypothetical protein
MFETSDIVVFALEAGVVVAVLMFGWRWGRRNNRFAVAAVTTAVGVLVWNAILNKTNASGFLVETPRLRIAWQDAGTGVLVFFVTTLAFGLVAEPAEPARRVVTAGALAGLVACAMDVFLLS